jgi:hypothetical protein
MNSAATTDDRYQARQIRSAHKLAYWTLAWVLTVFVLAFGPKFIWSGIPALTLVALAANLLVGVGLIVANKNYVNRQDELQRKISLDAMAITLGAVFVVGIPYELMSRYGLIPFRATPGHLYFVMALTYLTAHVLGQRRYR